VVRTLYRTVSPMVIVALSMRDSISTGDCDCDQILPAGRTRQRIAKTKAGTRNGICFICPILWMLLLDNDTAATILFDFVFVDFNCFGAHHAVYQSFIDFLLLFGNVISSDLGTDFIKWQRGFVFAGVGL